MSRFLAAALVLLVGSVVMGQATSKASSQKKPTADELIGQWMEMSGWTSDKHEAVMTKWTGWETDGVIVSAFDRAQPNSFLAETSIPGDTQKTSIGSTGKLNWFYTSKGEGDDVKVLELETLTPQRLFLFELIFNPMWLGSIESHSRKIINAGKVDFSGDSCWRVLCLPNGARKAVELYFSTETGYWRGLKTRLEGSKANAVDVRVHIDEFGFAGNSTLAKMAGPGLPVHLRIYNNDDLFQDLQVEQFKLQDAISEFAIPAAVRNMANKNKVQRSKSSPTRNPEGSGASGNNHAKLISMIGPELMTASGQSVPTSDLADKSNVLLYFSAKWCPPCRKFTPSLVEFFDDHSEDGDFTVIFVSSDKSIDQMTQYMKDYKMNFYAVPFSRVGPSGLKSTYGGRGIPNLVWIDSNDNAIAKSYVDGTYVGPTTVLQKFNESMSAR